MEREGKHRKVASRVLSPPALSSLHALPLFRRRRLMLIELGPFPLFSPPNKPFLLRLSGCFFPHKLVSSKCLAAAMHTVQSIPFTFLMFPSISSPLPPHSSRHSYGLLDTALPRDEAGAGAPGAAQARLQTAGTRRRGAHARPPGANLPKLEVRHDISREKNMGRK